MATLTDEEKAAKVLGDVDAEKQDETTEPEETESEEEQVTEETESEEETEEEASTEEESKEEESTTFTKQFPNLKGDTPADYIKELETSYQNSTTEALRWKTIAEEGAKLVEEAKSVIAGKQPEQQSTTTDPSLLQIDSHPDVQYAKNLREREMISAFDEFKKDYPQALEEDEFAKFTKASTGVYTAFEASNGRKPSYGELYKGIANLLGWQSPKKTAAKDAKIKESFSSSQTNSSTQPTSRQSKVSDEEANVYMRMTGKTRAEAVKDLSEVKV